MRAMTEKQNAKFISFYKNLSNLAKIDPLRQIKTTSPQSLQFITFHLIFEYMLENWINYKINNGENLFRGIKKIGFHNKMYIAKNAGFPKDIFNCLDIVNNIRNEFAHQIDKSSLKTNEMDTLFKQIKEIDTKGNSVESVSFIEDGITYFFSDTNSQSANTLIYLHLLSGKIRNYIFTDIYEHHSRPL